MDSSHNVPRPYCLDMRKMNDNLRKSSPQLHPMYQRPIYPAGLPYPMRQPPNWFVPPPMLQNMAPRAITLDRPRWQVAIPRHRQITDSSLRWNRRPPPCAFIPAENKALKTSICSASPAVEQHLSSTQAQHIQHRLKNNGNSTNSFSAHKPAASVSSPDNCVNNPNAAEQNYASQDRSDSGIYHDRNHNKVYHSSTFESKRYHPYVISTSSPIIMDTWSQKHVNSFNNGNNYGTDHRHQGKNEEFVLSNACTTSNASGSTPPVAYANENWRIGRHESRTEDCITSVPLTLETSCSEKQKPYVSSRVCTSAVLSEHSIETKPPHVINPNTTTKPVAPFGHHIQPRSKSSDFSRSIPAISSAVYSRSGSGVHIEHEFPIGNERVVSASTVPSGVNVLYERGHKCHLDSKLYSDMLASSEIDRVKQQDGGGTPSNDKPSSTLDSTYNMAERGNESCLKNQQQPTILSCEGHDNLSRKKCRPAMTNQEDRINTSLSGFDGSSLAKRVRTSVHEAIDDRVAISEREMDNNKYGAMKSSVHSNSSNSSSQRQQYETSSNANNIIYNPSARYETEHSQSEKEGCDKQQEGNMIMDKNADELLLSMKNRRIKINRLLKEQKRLMANLNAMKHRHNAPLQNYSEHQNAVQPSSNFILQNNPGSRSTSDG